jgi:AraC-like DNA-binding protein
VGFKEGWLLSGAIWQVLRIVQLLIYPLLGYSLVRRYVIKNGVAFFAENKKLIVLMYWLCIYILLCGCSLALLVSNAFPKNGLVITTVVTSLFAVVSYLYLILNPEVLYGIKGMWVTVELLRTALNTPLSLEPTTDVAGAAGPLQQQTDTELSEPPMRKMYLTQLQVAQLEDALTKYMQESKTFLQPRFSLPQMARETGQPLQYISAFLNQHLGENFNDYVNRSRVNHLIGVYENDESLVQQLTLESLGKQVGFGSRSTFIKAFKKVTGQTPSAYFRA